MKKRIVAKLIEWGYKDPVIIKLEKTKSRFSYRCKTCNRLQDRLIHTYKEANGVCRKCKASQRKIEWFIANYDFVISYDKDTKMFKCRCKNCGTITLLTDHGVRKRSGYDACNSCKASAGGKRVIRKQKLLELDWVLKYNPSNDKYLVKCRSCNNKAWLTAQTISLKLKKELVKCNTCKYLS